MSPVELLNLVLVAVNLHYLLGESIAPYRLTLRTVPAPASTHLVGIHRSALPLSQAYRYR